MSSSPGGRDSSRWRRAEAVFAAAVELPAGERRAHVEAACGDDHALRHAVLSLLESDERAGAFLAGPLGDPALGDPAPGDPLLNAPSDGTADDEAERRIGAYRLLGVLGEGGMSTVYRALRDDDTFRREVALKVIRRGMESAETRRRFHLERQILAALEHPHIARLYDGGVTREGLPYLVMERVVGEPVDEYCERRGLGVEARLVLVRRICAAVHHAHQSLVVHRDLKPSNILVTADGEPRLLDFGIAKLLAPALVRSAEPEPTAAWLRLITPDYASPEHIRGEAVTTASDVYSLGVLLYRLLTGRLPHDLEGKSLPEMERAVTGGVPEPPSRRVAPPSRRRRLAGDLDVIALKALHPEPARRYASAIQLADDLGRHLAGFPVEARPDSLAYRTGKFLRRHRTAVAAAVLVLGLLVASGVALARSSARVAAERDQLRQVLTFVQDVFNVSREGEELTVREAVDRSAVLLERTLTGQPEVQATLRHTLGGIYLDLGAVPQARRQLERATALRAERFGVSSVQHAESLSALGVALALDGEAAAGAQRAQRAVEIYEGLLGPRDPALVRPLNGLVGALCVGGDFAAAEAPSVRALELARGGPPVDDLELADAVSHRALLRSRAGDLDAAEALYGEALELLRRRLGAEHPEIASVLSNLATTYRRRGDLARAQALFRQTVELERRLYRNANANLARSLYNLASVLRDGGSYGEAEALFRESRDMAQEVFGQRHYTAVVITTGLASAILGDGRPAEAAALLEAGLERWRRELPDESLLERAESLLLECRAAL